MRVAIAGFSLESASFLPAEMTVRDFQKNEASGGDIVDKYRGTNTVCGGFVDVCEKAGIEMVGVVHTDGGAAGPCADEAFDHYTRAICEGLAEQRDAIDGVLLHLHGSLVTPTRVDPDTDIVREVRRVVGRKLPVMVALDYHGNLDAAMLHEATALFGYHFSPHTDMGETGQRAAECMVRTLRGEIRPMCAIAKPNVMVPSIFSATALSPLKDIVAESLAWPGRVIRYLDVSVFAGFSYADVPNCGFSAVAVADGDRELAARVVSEMSGRIRALRHALYKRELVLGLREGVALALQKARAAERPIVLLEHADRMNDSTYVLREILRQDGGRVAIPYLWDPAAASAAVSAGKGALVRLAVGGRSSPRAGGPVTIEGKVLFAGEKEYRVTGPMHRGRLVRLGPTAVVDTGNVVISITSNPLTAIDEDPFIQFGLNPRDFDVIVLRSKTHFRAVYEQLAEEILIVDTPDWGPADLTTLPYRHVPKEKVFPFTDQP